MSRNTSPARHRAAVDGNIALQGLSRAARAHATTIGRPVAVAAVTSGIALSAMGTAHAGTYTEQGTTAPAAVVAAATSHTVVAGDTLGAISARYGVDLNAVLSANGLSISSVIVPGQKILLPTAGTVAAPVRTVSVPVAVAPAAPAAQQVLAPVAATPAAPAAQQVPVTSTVAAPAAQAPAMQQAAATQAAYAAYQAPVATTNTGAGSDYQLTSTGVNARSSQSAAATAPAGNLGGIILGSAQAQLAAGAIQDCTVLAEVALRAAGIPVGDLGPSQFLNYGTLVGTPAPGDLVVTGGHVAIYAGGGQVISSGMNGSNSTMQHPLSDLPGAQFVRVSR